MRWSNCSAPRTRRANPRNPNPEKPRRSRNQKRETSDECECNPGRLWHADRTDHAENPAAVAWSRRAHLGLSDRQRTAPQMARGRRHGDEGRHALRVRLAQQRTDRSARQTSGRLWRRASDAEPDHGTRSAAQDFIHLGQYRRRFVRARGKGRESVTDGYPSPPAEPRLRAARRTGLAHASRYSRCADDRHAAGAILGRLDPPAEGIRRTSAGLTRGVPPTSTKATQEVSHEEQRRFGPAVGSCAPADAREGEGLDPRPRRARRRAPADAMAGRGEEVR